MTTTSMTQWQAFTKAAGDFGTQVQAAFAVVGERVRELFRGMSKAFAPVSLAYRRGQYGGNRTDAYNYPEAWTSTVCGAWLCRAGEPCPSNVHRLGCTCRCHEG